MLQISQSFVKMQHEEAGSVWMRLDESYSWARARLKRIKEVLTSDELEMGLLVQTPQVLCSAPWLCWCHGSIRVASG